MSFVAVVIFAGAGRFCLRSILFANTNVGWPRVVGYLSMAFLLLQFLAMLFNLRLLLRWRAFPTFAFVNASHSSWPLAEIFSWILSFRFTVFNTWTFARLLLDVCVFPKSS
jgi:hypothetical protein